MANESSVRRTSSQIRSLNTYPHQFFDLSTQYIPPSMKEMFRWCLYLYVTHSEIAPIINKKCSYVLTPYIFETDSDKTHDAWQELLERILDLREFEYKMQLDLEVYGNSFCSIFYPFERFLECKLCKAKAQARLVEWEYDNHEFRGVCAECKQKTVYTPNDKPIRNRKRIKLIRWYPQYIDIRYNPFTGRSVYIYRIPKHIKTMIIKKDQNKILVEETPIVFLEAMKKKKNIEFDPDNIYHMKTPSVSMEDDSFGMPPMLNIFKDAWLYQTYRRAQEAIALDHILPMTILSPAPSPDGLSPHMSTNLADWSGKIQTMVQRWRRDPIGIFTVPFSANVQQIRGDAQALNVHNDMNQVRQQIAGGLDVPQEFIYGGLTWSGSSISLRVLENLFLTRIEQLNGFLRDFIIPKLQRFLSLPKIMIRHADFKMADDAQQKQIALGLRQTNTISDRTTVEELGFDYEEERIRRTKEDAERLELIDKQQIAQAELQSRVMAIQAKGQAIAQIEAQKAIAEATAKDQQESEDQTAYEFAEGIVEEENTQKKADNEMEKREEKGEKSVAAQKKKEGAADKKAPEGPPEAKTITKSLKLSPEILDSLANNFLKTVPPSMVQQELDIIAENDPPLAKAIKSRMKMIAKQTKDIKPLPESKPPRRADSPI